MKISPYQPEWKAEILSLSVRAWEPVFPRLREAVPGFVYNAFYPRGWLERQLADLSLILDGEPGNVRVAVDEGKAIGWVCVRLRPQDRMGEIYVLAVDPPHQRKGVARALMDHAFREIGAAGMDMVMVETGDDPGHAASRATYEAAGFDRWPVARYFKDLRPPSSRSGQVFSGPDKARQG